MHFPLHLLHRDSHGFHSLSFGKHRVSLFSFLVLMSIVALTAVSPWYLALGEPAPPGRQQPLPLRSLCDAAGATRGGMCWGRGQPAPPSMVKRRDLPQAAQGRARTVVPVATQASASSQGPACPEHRGKWGNLVSGGFI